MNYRNSLYGRYLSTHFANMGRSADSSIYSLYVSSYTKRRVKRWLPYDKSLRIVEVACGAGYFMEYLRTLGYKNIAGVDISHEQVTAATCRGLPIEHGDLFDYMAKHIGQIDFVVALDILEHLSKPELVEFANSLHASLVKGGGLLAHTINAQSLIGARDLYSDLTHELSFTPASIYQLLRLAGFVDIRIWPDLPPITGVRSGLMRIIYHVFDLLLKLYLFSLESHHKGVVAPRIWVTAKKA